MTWTFLNTKMSNYLRELALQRQKRLWR